MSKKLGNTYSEGVSVKPLSVDKSIPTDTQMLDFLDKISSQSLCLWQLTANSTQGTVYLSRNCSSGFDTVRETIRDYMEKII